MKENINATSTANDNTTKLNVVMAGGEETKEQRSIDEILTSIEQQVEILKAKIDKIHQFVARG